MRTEDRTLARQIARIELHVVFPTPPFPPTKTHLRDSWSRMFCTVASGISAAIVTASSFVLLFSPTLSFAAFGNLSDLACGKSLTTQLNAVWFNLLGCLVFGLQNQNQKRCAIGPVLIQKPTETQRHRFLNSFLVMGLAVRLKTLCCRRFGLRRRIDLKIWRFQKKKKRNSKCS